RGLPESACSHAMFRRRLPRAAELPAGCGRCPDDLVRRTGQRGAQAQAEAQEEGDSQEEEDKEEEVQEVEEVKEGQEEVAQAEPQSQVPRDRKACVRAR